VTSSTALKESNTAAAATVTAIPGGNAECYKSNPNSSTNGISYCEGPGIHKHIVLGAALGSVIGFIVICITVFLCIKRRREVRGVGGARHVDVDKVLATLREDVEGKHPQPHQDQKTDSMITMSPIERTGKWLTQDQRDSRSSLGLRAMMKKPEPARKGHKTGLSIVKTDPRIDEILLGKEPQKESKVPARWPSRKR
jgi:hypothetical protein